ncbi:MAG: cell division protein CrgA [Actinomycetales bacterium]|nr:cell division protein CrgA [Actinomycetales bacterium]
MPESKSRKKASYTPPSESKAPKPNAPWFVPTMLSLMGAGLVWIVATYVFKGEYPIPGIGNANLIVGFVLILVGFGMMTRWR